jgi:hypothetical protein
VSRIAIVPLVLWSALLGSGGDLVAQSRGDDLVTRGDRLLAEFRTEAAIEAYRSGFAAAPDDVELLWKTARALSNLADETPGDAGDETRMEEAVVLSRRAVRAGPAISRAHTTLAASLGKLALFRGGKRKVELARGSDAVPGAAISTRDSASTALGVLDASSRP